MRILVTGGAGFIGSHLCERLHRDGHQVYSLDNYSTGSEDNHIDGVVYIKGNTRDIASLVVEVPDLVYHLGEYARVEQSFDEIEKVWTSNKDGTFAVLNYCKELNVKIVYAGSSTKFGDGGLARAGSPYSWMKASNTELVSNYGSWYGLEYAIVYFYNVYGGREISHGKYATLIAIFLEQYRQGKPLTVVSPGVQQRNFTHIDDIVSGLVLVGKEGSGDNFGIGCSKSYTVLQIAEYFNCEIQMLPERKGNRMSGKVVCEKTQKLGWSETKSLFDYLDRSIKNINSNTENEK